MIDIELKLAGQQLSASDKAIVEDVVANRKTVENLFAEGRYLD